MVELHIILALAAANLVFTVFHRFDVKKRFADVANDLAAARGRFKVNFNALKHDVERECSICHLKVNRYVPNGDGTKIACANCIIDGKVDNKTDFK